MNILITSKAKVMLICLFTYFALVIGDSPESQIKSETKKTILVEVDTVDTSNMDSSICNLKMLRTKAKNEVMKLKKLFKKDSLIVQ